MTPESKLDRWQRYQGPSAKILYIDMGFPVYFDEGGYKVYRNPRWNADPAPYQVSKSGYGKVSNFATPEEAIADAHTRIKESAIIKATTAKESWQMTKKEWYNFLRTPEGGRVSAVVGTSHYNIVREALSEDKPVPSAVLADYPELRG